MHNAPRTHQYGGTKTELTNHDMHDHTHALTNQMIIVPSTNLRRRHATQREGRVSMHRWMDGWMLLHSHVRSRSGSRRPDDGRKQLLCLLRACAGTARRGFFVAFDRSTIICAPHSGRGPLPLPRPSRPSHIRSSCVALRCVPGYALSPPAPHHRFT